MMFDIFVAADSNWGIGKTNDLPWPKLSGELKRFRQLTTEAAPGKQNAIIMGRKTWDSIGKPLPKRHNIVISTKNLALPEPARYATSLDAALVLCEDPQVDNIFVIGGGEIYRIALEHPELRYIYITRVNGEFNCDITIPNLENISGLVLEKNWAGNTSAEENSVSYRFERWVKTSNMT
jgi:dihydrofolate reductase